jgi:hypothetical protein
MHKSLLDFFLTKLHGWTVLEVFMSFLVVCREPDWGFWVGVGTDFYFSHLK